MTARLLTGGLIDRSQPMRFSFDGRSMPAFAGDTIASALLANGVRIVGRSFKLHRPRGIVGAGCEDASVVERLTPRRTTNLQATTTALEDGSVLRSINAWPSAAFDVGAVAQAFAPLLPAGFYYKTFMRPSWHLFEPFVRHAAGLGGVPPADSWTPVSESRFAHTDILVVGAGPAGLVAALVAARSGLRVMLVDDGAHPGGRLLDDEIQLDGRPAADWIDGVIDELHSMSNVRMLCRATIWGYHEHNYLTIVERSPRDVRELDYRHWKLRALHVIIAAGAIERSIAFANNDRPGIMQASAVSSYLARYAVLPGRRAVVFANASSAYRTAHRLRSAGADVTIVDARPSPNMALVAAARSAGITVAPGSLVNAGHGARAVRATSVIDPSGKVREIECDLVAVGGGWNPAV